MFTYTFMQNAFLTGIVIAIACSLLGVFLVLRRYALIGDGIAHISFGGVALGLLFNIMPFLSALVFSLVGALSILQIKEKAKLGGDAAIGIVSHSSLGIGIFIASMANGFNVDILSYLFGSILAITRLEMWLSIGLAITVILVVVLKYNELFYMTFSEESAKTSGVRVNVLNTVIILLTAVTVVGAMRVVGLMLVSALLILPASSALQLKVSFKATFFFSALFGVLSVLTGLMVSYWFDYAPSGTIVLVNTVLFLLAYGFKTLFTSR